MGEERDLWLGLGGVGEKRGTYLRLSRVSLGRITASLQSPTVALLEATFSTIPKKRCLSDVFKQIRKGSVGISADWRVTDSSRIYQKKNFLSVSNLFFI